MPHVTPILDLNAFQDREGGDSGNGLLDRRRRNFGAASVLFYDEPIEMVRAEGAYMTAADGRRYLDMYNNVPSVGHCHPDVVNAVAEQARRLNISTRYLHETVERYIERLRESLTRRPTNILLCCTGSEANDLALRIAMSATGGQGVVVTEAAYHGNTWAVTQVSPSAWKRGSAPPHVRLVPAPGRRAFGDAIGEGFAAAVRGALADLARHGLRPAALICDSIFSSDGVFSHPPGFLGAAVAAVHEAGALLVADEVQPGFGRTGEALWGFQRHGLEPDIVTMGKPMGNGFPMAGVATRPELLAAFCRDVGYFNTFGGNPVAAAAGLAVLDVIERERLQANALSVGAHLKGRIEALRGDCPVIAEVRGSGLFIGVELCRPDRPDEPDAQVARAVIAGLRDRQVLIGAAGSFGNVLKVRPPLCLTVGQADQFVDALAWALGRLPV